jgi:hypothetical protein
MDAIVLSTALTALLANIGLGGGIFEHGVVDRAWPRKPEIIQPGKGGISRVRFWIPAHSAFELALLITLYLGWNHDGVRKALLLALAAHVTLRLWSAFDMIPKAIAFEKAPTVDEAAAREWAHRSLMRFPLALLTSLAALAAFAAACGAGL